MTTWVAAAETPARQGPQAPARSGRSRPVRLSNPPATTGRLVGEQRSDRDRGQHRGGPTVADVAVRADRPVAAKRQHRPVAYSGIPPRARKELRSSRHRHAVDGSTLSIASVGSVASIGSIGSAAHRLDLVSGLGRAGAVGGQGPRPNAAQCPPEPSPNAAQAGLSRLAGRDHLSGRTVRFESRR